MSTGWLALTGVVLVLLTSAYVGLTNSTLSEASDPVGVATATPTSEMDPEVTPTPEPEPEAPPPEPTPEPPPPPPANRANCDQIRGTAYNSPEERQWYLANCVNN